MIERTTNRDFITACVTHPNSWNATTDDEWGSSELYFPPINEDTIWLKAGDHGVFLVIKQNMVTYEVHGYFLPSIKGKSVEIGKDLIRWVFDNLPCKRLITSVPNFNVESLRMIKKSGMTEYGVNPKSFQKDGVLYDQTLLGVSK